MEKECFLQKFLKSFHSHFFSFSLFLCLFCKRYNDGTKKNIVLAIFARNFQIYLQFENSFCNCLLF